MNNPYDQTAGLSLDPMLIDIVFPDYEFKGQRGITIHASPAQIFSAIRTVTLADMPIAAALIWLRYLPGRLSGAVQSQTSEMKPALEETLKGMIVLAEKPDRELVLGAIARLHQIVDQDSQPVYSREAFEMFADPAYQKYVIDVRLTGAFPRAGCRLTIDHRLHALSETSRRQFARYWLVIGLVSWFMLGILLGAIKRRAE